MMGDDLVIGSGRRGEIARAMLEAAWPPAHVAQVCERAQVGAAAGRYTASRLLDAGELVVLEVPPAAPGRRGRPPAVVASRAALARMRAERGGAAGVLPPAAAAGRPTQGCSFWEVGVPMP